MLSADISASSTSRSGQLRQFKFKLGFHLFVFIFLLFFLLLHYYLLLHLTVSCCVSELPKPVFLILLLCPGTPTYAFPGDETFMGRSPHAQYLLVILLFDSFDATASALLCPRLYRSRICTSLLANAHKGIVYSDRGTALYHCLTLNDFFIAMVPELLV